MVFLYLPGAVLAALGSLDGGGTAEAAFPVPPDPALYGTRVYFQAAAGTRLTNGEVLLLVP
jgi:hypothetical protein